MKHELEIMSSLSHPNIVRVMGGSIRPPTMLIVEELMTGGSLYQCLHKVNNTGSNCGQF
jgi:serine/threonine protein kinase